MKVRAKPVGLLVVVLLVLAIATAGSTENPPVERNVVWNTPRTAELFARACADCHSHETRWPWYARVQPVAWWVRHHVEEGREHFNVSVADRGDAHEAAEEVREGKMPLSDYTWLGMHPEAKLTEAERAELVRGLSLTFGTDEYGSNATR